MPDTVHVPGAELSVTVSGGGPSVLLVHGIADRGEGWSEVAAALAGDARVIAYDRRGYGASSAPEPYGRTTVAEQAEDAAALIDALDAAPAVVAGRDLGALVALDLATRHRARVAAIVAIDPPLYAFSPSASEVLGAERTVLEDALRDGGPAVAVRAWLEARGAAAERLAWAGEDFGAFFADFAGLATWPTSRRELRALDVPLAVLLSEAAAQHVRDGAEALASLVPGATLGAEADLAPTLRALAPVALDPDIRGQPQPLADLAGEHGDGSAAVGEAGGELEERGEGKQRQGEQ
jgi:pimeloyl-ACP methyl ester carboxylesterase